VLVCALFACQEAAPEPLQVTAVSPPLGALAGGTRVLLQGRGFSEGVTVRFGDSAAASVEVSSAGELWAVTPPGPSEPAEVAVTLGRSDGVQASWDDRFTYYRLDLSQAAEPLRAPTPVAMTTADLDRDGRLDVAVATAEPAGLVLLRGQADGGLAYWRRIDVTRRPAGVAAADINADGQVDLVVLDGADPAVRILRGSGSALGAFTPAAPLLLPCPPSALAVGDLDGDRRGDLVVTCASAGALLIRNQGDRADGLGPLLAAPQPLAGGTAPSAAILADLDHDGAADVGVLSGAGRLYLHYGDHGGGLLPVQDVPAGQAPAGLLPLDVDGDGKDELLIPDRSGGVLVLKATGQALLTRWQRPSAPVGTSLLAPVPGGELVHVLALGGDTGEGVRFLLEDANLIRPAKVSLGGPLAALLSRDLNGDGAAELLALGAGGTLTVHHRVDGSLVQAQSVSLLPAPQSGLAADLDGDGWADLLWTEEGADAVRVRYSRGDGTFEPVVSYPTAAGPAAISVADLNGDRAPDLAVACPRAGTTSILISVAPRSFQAAFDVASGPRPALLTLVDVSGDGKADLVATGEGASDLFVLVGRGNGTLAPAQRIEVGGAARALLSLDLDEDGRRDVLVLGDDGLRGLRGLGDGTFAPPQLNEAGEAPRRMVALDSNLDGVRDLAVLGPGELRLLLGHPDGRFTLAQRLQVAAGARALAALDVDRDGDLDVVVADGRRAELGVLLGRPDGTLLPPVTLPAALVPQLLLALDTDSDRQSDLVLVGAAGQAVVQPVR
jgi:hypothetical protein